MEKLLVLLVFVIGAVNAQGDICVGAEDFTRFKVPGSCTEYYECEANVAYPESCEEGLQFDEEAGECLDEEEVQCSSDYPEYPEYPETDYPDTDPPADDTTTTTRSQTIETTTPPRIPTTLDPTIPEIECPTNRPGEIIFFPSSNCSEYYICANGFRMKMACMEGFTWNQEERQCDFPIFSRCSVSFE
jgi:hypothetical protein